MKFLNSLLLLASAAVATPILSTRQVANGTRHFTLKTVEASHPQHNDLYVYAYHTGAGFNDAVLSSDKNDASAAFLNGTHTQFDLDTPFPWGFSMPGDTNYAAWEPVEINTGYGTEGFHINDAGLQWSEQQGFGGWLVCDWYHNAPQLFYQYRWIEATALPATCSKVKLSAEYTDS